MSPAGTIILLTGAAQGIGRATARALADRGHRMALLDRAAAPLAAVVEEIQARGGTAEAEAVDVRDRLALLDAVGRLEGKLGAVDVVVACAGVGSLASVFELDTPGLRAMLEVNVLGVAHTIEAVLPGMLRRGSGHIVGISSVAGYRGLPWMPGYSASKAALTTYLEGLRPALALRGIAVTTVCPGFVRTGITIATPFARPVPMLEPEDAARQIVRAIARRPRDYAFPLATALHMGLIRRLPNWAFDRLMRWVGPQALSPESYKF